MRGNIEFENNGVQRGFRFGTFAIAIACKEAGAESIEELFRTIVIPPVNQVNLMYLYYGAACQYADHKKQKVDFSVSDVSEWLEDLGIEKVQEVFRTFLEQYIPKNVSPPMKTGEPKETELQSTTVGG